MARRLALDVLYEAEIRDDLPMEVFSAREREGWVIPGAGDEDPEMLALDLNQEPGEGSIAYARELVAGVQSHHADLDALIARYADRWAIERMPIVDRNLLRMALFELLFRDDIPVAVAINEAVELAKALSTEDSGRFINGLLGRVAERELSAD